MMTKIANTAMSDGYNVLQIFFEDNPKVIQRKHLSFQYQKVFVGMMKRQARLTLFMLQQNKMNMDMHVLEEYQEQ